MRVRWPRENAFPVGTRRTLYIVNAHMYIYTTRARLRGFRFISPVAVRRQILNIHTHFTRTRRTTPHNLQYIRTRVYIYTIHIICSLLTHMCLVHTLYTYNIS